MAVGIKDVETTSQVPNRIYASYNFPRTCVESPVLFFIVLLRKYFFFIAITRKTDKLGFEERVFSFKYQVTL